jgi:hypothetical protein
MNKAISAARVFPLESPWFVDLTEYPAYLSDSDRETFYNNPLSIAGLDSQEPKAAKDVGCCQSL